MNKNASDICFSDVADLAEIIVDKIATSDEEISVEVVGKYPEIREMLEEVISYGVSVKSIELYDDADYEYNDEYYLDIIANDDGTFARCTPSKNEGEYLTTYSDIVYIFDNCSSKVLPYCNSSITYYVSFDEFVEDDWNELNCCDGNCNCDCCCDKNENKTDDKQDGNYAIKIACGIDSEEAEKLIEHVNQSVERMNQSMGHMNDMFREFYKLNTPKNAVEQIFWW